MQGDLSVAGHKQTREAGQPEFDVAASGTNAITDYFFFIISPTPSMNKN